MKLATGVLLAALGLTASAHDRHEEPPPGWRPGPRDTETARRSLEGQTIPEDMDGELTLGPSDDTDRLALDYLRSLQRQAGALRLTANQLDELDRLSYKLRLKRVRLKTAIAESRLRLRHALASRPPDFASAAAEVEVGAKACRELSAVTVAAVQAAYNSLTAEQRNQFEALPSP